MQKDKVLVVDDEEHIVELLKFNLLNEGYEVFTANNGIEAVSIALEKKPKLILLDVMLPGIDGFDVCKEIKNNKDTSKIGIIMLTAKGEEIDKVQGLNIGADDYITKPFSIKELLARVNAVLRRSSIKEEKNIYNFGSLIIDENRHEVIVNGEKVDISVKEYELLEILVHNKSEIVKREVLIGEVWGYDYVGETRTVDVHIRYLRKKIEKDDKNPRFIETIRGVGYRFNPKVEEND